MTIITEQADPDSPRMGELPSASPLMMPRAEIARVAHEVNRAYAQSLGDTSLSPWEDAPEWQRSSAISGVNFHLENPQAGPEASHENWLKDKIDAGWTYGETKDEAAKTHPCIRPFCELPREQQSKDYIFRAVVHSLGGAAAPGTA